MPSFEHGIRGWATSSTTVPIRQRSPITAPVTSSPSVVRFSPNIPGGISRSSCSPHHCSSSRAYAYTALSGPPWTRRSACSSPATLTPSTRTRPSTGALPIALISGRPRRTEICFGRPTLTENRRATPQTLARRHDAPLREVHDHRGTEDGDRAEDLDGAQGLAERDEDETDGHRRLERGEDRR